MLHFGIRKTAALYLRTVSRDYRLKLGKSRFEVLPFKGNSRGSNLTSISRSLSPELKGKRSDYRARTPRKVRLTPSGRLSPVAHGGPNPKA